MKRVAIALTVCLVLVFVGYTQRRGLGRSGGDLEKPPMAKTESEKKILSVLDRMRAAGDVYAEVPPSDGRMLRLMAEAIGAKEVLEIGTSTGYSGLWLCMALQKTEGKLTTYEIDAERAADARRHFKEAGVDRIVTLVEGDAHQRLKERKEPVDLVFIDADKEGYVDYLRQVLPLLRPGGVILAHNTGMVPDYINAVTTSPDLETVFYTQGGGLSVTLKKR
ncbi:MAG: O-methyltransferase [Acidobacteria bacterium]|nr:MAG: O-methyltransferase [Acidobacteriota bacterium]